TNPLQWGMTSTSPSSMDDIQLADNTNEHRFELRKGGVVAAHSEYNLLKGAVMFTHTEVQPQFEGQGIGSRLAAYALDDVRKRGLKVVPVCQFIAGYIRRHPEYLDLVSDESRRAFHL
ncbi:MAG TPA: GNAT family N-acetyltransferase, partial [Ramlibacter sp.]|nr:GNAT family N-acetyltransferase [Ramlibacter sp.]